MIKKILLVITVLLLSIFYLTKQVSAQMMWGVNTNLQLSATPSAEDISDVKKGQELYTQFLDKKISCNTVKDEDFEKIGEYVMEQRFSSTEQHIAMNNKAKQMMGETGEEQMHIRLGRNATGCFSNGGGEFSMMGFGNYGYGMMNGLGGGFGLVEFLFWVVVFIDLVLLGIYLWKKIIK